MATMFLSKYFPLETITFFQRSCHFQIHVIESSSLKRMFQFGKQSKVARSKVKTIRELTKLNNPVFHKKLVDKLQWMSRCIVMVVKLPLFHKSGSFLFCITQSFQNFFVILFICRLTFWSVLVINNSFPTCSDFDMLSLVVTLLASSIAKIGLSSGDHTHKLIPMNFDLFQHFRLISDWF